MKFSTVGKVIRTFAGVSNENIEIKEVEVTDDFVEHFDAQGINDRLIRHKCIQQAEVLRCLYNNDSESLTKVLSYNSYEIVNFEYNHKRTNLLHIACYHFKHTSSECIKILLSKGANPEIPDFYKKQAIHYAAMTGNCEKLQMIINWYVANRKTLSENNVLLFLLRYIYNKQKNEQEYVEILKLLLNPDLGINIYLHDANFFRNTAIQSAVWFGYDKFVKIFIRYGGASGKLTVTDFNAEYLESQLDTCIYYENEDHDILNKYHCIIFNYRFLLPPKSAITHWKPKCEPEIEMVKYISQSPEMNYLLTHPLIMLFTYLKWLRINTFFYVNLCVFLVFILSLTAYLLGQTSLIKPEYEYINCYSYIILCVTSIILAFRELIQLVIFKFRYFKQIENWVEVTLLAIILIISLDETNLHVKKQLLSVAILLAAVEFLFLLRQIPALATTIMMLCTVSYTFFKLLMWSSIILMAFALSFYILFENGSASEEFYKNPGMTLLKMFVMLAGELKSSDIKFDSAPVTTHLIFVVSVFSIHIVLFSLLNGLAVSDIKKIQKDAEIYSQIRRIEQISYFENVLLSYNIPKLFPIMKRICLFRPDDTENIIRYVSTTTNVEINDGDKNTTCCKSKIKLDGKMQQIIKQFMHNKKDKLLQKMKENEIMTNISEIKKQLATMQNK